MDDEFRMVLDRRLGDSRLEIKRLKNMSFLEDEDSIPRIIIRQKMEAHHKRIHFIEKLLKIEDFLSDLGPAPKPLP